MTIASSTDILSAARSRHDHVVDVLIAERAPNLTGHPAWPLLRPALYGLLDYGKARRMADAIAPLPGADALETVSRLLDVKLHVQNLDRLPRTGRCVVIANHPTGIADGVAVYDAFKHLRPDLCFYANSDAHRVSPGFQDVLIPVEWVEEKRTRERTRLTLQLTREAMEAERALVIFPAGRLARRGPDGTLADPAWMPSAVSIARKFDAPVAPLHMAGPWSTLFHFFNRFSAELRDITLFHELLNKRGRRFSLTLGPLIPPEALAGEAQAATEALKAYVERALPADPDRPFA
ncbi:GNAT family N-acetyltransferase [Phenylobacterium sp.]|uniref:GNAT family N-acetyltransferase n=1 Tax=Phenylobacterium sp. TaxID=1871053 RepID=UPI0017A02428|nr:1-acyl-sn-glycerol-3-phosphate acyltransferase [Phenylobacterium sp.]MBA4793610.1 1-acyl-sn-glycerol-3-phosphate acyltransferase [Phenylobacterium sp.]